MTSPHERLATLLRERRKELGLSQIELATKASIGESAIRSLESGRGDGHRPTTLRAVSQAVDWTPDSAERILDGHEPVEAVEDGRSSAALEERVDELEARLRAVMGELRQMKADRGSATEASYDVNLDDPEERALWNLTTIPEAERWGLIVHLREMHAEERHASGN